MINISAAQVKELREKTSAGMMDCKKALTECNGDFEASIDWLRKKGLSAANKKADRVAVEGLVASYIVGKKGAILELNAETDFVARNDKFQNLVRKLLKAALDFDKDLESFKKYKFDHNRTVNEEITEHVVTIGENINLRRFKCLSVDNGVVVNYTHNAIADGLGKIGVLVALESEADAEELIALGKQIAMHIAAAKPESLTINELDQNIIEREKNIFSEQAIAAGKPQEVIDKMIEGRIRKFYEEVVLLEQAFVMDSKLKISQVIENVQNRLKKSIKLTNFVRYSLGEGIDKKGKE